MASQSGMLARTRVRVVPPAGEPAYALGAQLRLAGKDPRAGRVVGDAEEDLCAQEGGEDDGAGAAADFQRAGAAPELGRDVLEGDQRTDIVGSHGWMWAAGKSAARHFLGKIAAAFPTLRRRPRVLLGVCGSVAAVKLPELAMRLSASAEVRLMLTASGKHFVENVAPSYNPAVWEKWLRMKHLFPVFEDKDEWAGYTDVGTDSVLHIEVRHAASPRRPPRQIRPAASRSWAILPLPPNFAPPLACAAAQVGRRCGRGAAVGQHACQNCRRHLRQPAGAGEQWGLRACARADAPAADVRAEGVGCGPQAGGALPRHEYGHVAAPGHSEAPGDMPRGLPRHGGGAGGQDAGLRRHGSALPRACRVCGSGADAASPCAGKGALATVDDVVAHVIAAAGLEHEGPEGTRVKAADDLEELAGCDQ